MAHYETTGKTDEYYTPKYIFDALGVEFDMDVAAPVDRKFCHVPAKKFITKRSLQKKWEGFIWMNPPFSGRNSKTFWFTKISDHKNGIGLSPDRTSAPWWQQASKECDAFLLVAGKIKFIMKDGQTADQPGNGTTLFAYGSKAVAALKSAENKGLGIVFVRA